MPLSEAAEIQLIKMQQERIVSDIESEKGTRARLNADIIQMIKDIESRVRELEKLAWKGIGTVVAIQFLSTIALAFIFKK